MKGCALNIKCSGVYSIEGLATWPWGPWWSVLEALLGLALTIMVGVILGVFFRAPQKKKGKKNNVPRVFFFPL